MLAVLSIMISRAEAAEKVNTILHDYADAVLGRMGIPVRDRGVNVISLVLDTDAARINALGGKLGGIDGVRAKALYGGA